ncbi:MAG: hypothetical protein Q9157_007947 [Trypethelium eluteriae]
MPRAEVGSTKYLANKLKSKGLQRLRCESHVRQMQLVGEDPKRFINQYSREFQQNFLNQLRTSHGQKSIHANKFYNEVIADKQHVHLNSTRWKSLTEFVTYLGREGLCRVEDTEKGLHIAYIDNSPEALRRADAVRKKERQDKGDEEREQKLINAQIAKAKEAEEARGAWNDQVQADAEARKLDRNDGEKIKLSFASKPSPVKPPSPPDSQVVGETKEQVPSANVDGKTQTATPPAEDTPPPTLKISLGSTAPKTKNVFATGGKKNPLAGKKATVKDEPKKMSEMERIMKEEMARKRSSDGLSNDAKRQRIA